MAFGVQFSSDVTGVLILTLKGRGMTSFPHFVHIYRGLYIQWK